MSEETKMIMRAIQGMKKGLQGEMQEMRKEMQMRFDKTDRKLEFLGLKWIEHDEKIQEIRRQI